MAKQVNTKIGVDSKEAQTKIDKLTASFNKLGKEAKTILFQSLVIHGNAQQAQLKALGLVPLLLPK